MHVEALLTMQGCLFPYISKGHAFYNECAALLLSKII